MKLHQLLPLLIHQFKNESDLIKAIEELSLKFTQKRERITDYLHDERLTSAYTAFYLTTNLPKLEAVFEWMPQEWLELIKETTFIDLGAGPGTFSLAYREWLGKPAKIMQVETSAMMRDQARRIWDGFYPEEKLLNRPEGARTLFFGHSANEMGVEVALKYVRDFNPDHILFVEPGTKEFFPQILAIRDALLKDGFNIHFPCPTAAACPMKDSQEDWCHQFIHVKQESEVERLSQIVRKDRRNLPLIVHAFSRNFKAENPSVRVVRVFPQTKFSHEWESCELNQIQHYQVMKRSLSKASLNILSEVLAGASLEVQTEKELEGSKRVKILSLNNKPFEP